MSASDMRDSEMVDVEERERQRIKEKERHRHEERDRHGGSSRDKERDREKERRKERDSSSSKHHREREKDRDERERGGSSRQHERDERERDTDRDRDRKDREREKEKERSRNRGKDKERDRDREREREREREKSRERSLDRERDSKSKGRSRGEDEVADVAKGAVKEEQVKAAVDGKEVEPSSTAELRDRLTKMKQERLKEKMTDDASDILSWVSKSRKIEEKRNAEKEKALRLAQALEEQDNILAGSDDDDHDNDDKAAKQSGDHLAGVKVLHGLDKVMEGGAIVLTLKDQNILAGDDINEEVDMLENVEIGEQKQRNEAYKAAKKKTGVYYDKFSEDSLTKKPILSHYDDPIEDEMVALDESGHFTGEAEKKLEELRKRIEGGSVQKVSENLTTSTKISSEFYTAEEMLQFRKPKKKKSLRKKEKLDLDALESEAIAAGLGADDLGSRNDPKRRAAREEQEKAEADKRSSAYQAAIAKAEEASKVLRQENTLTAKSNEEELVFGEDYEDLQKSLEQARKFNLRKQEDAMVYGPQAVALLAAANKGQEDTTPAKEEAQENKVVITEMEEFVWGLQLNEESRKPDTEDVFMDEDDPPMPTEDEFKDESTTWTEVKEEKTVEEPAKDDKKDVEPDEILHEVGVGKGLAGALKLLQDRGTLNEGIEWGGRTTDKKKSKLVGLEDGPKEVRIERTDEFGRIMTPKEAFRVLSHKFHGKGPGKMKQEKRMKKYEEDLKTKQMKASDTPLMAMEKMRETQARMKTPYIVLSGQVKPGQTSDPKSGFATVEKDHVGSLTPMLGDKKVEHFLGIKKSSEPGSMGPPPPKKPKN